MHSPREIYINYVNGFTIMYGEVKNKIYHTVRTVPKSNRKIAETEAKSIPLTHIYTTTYFPVLELAFKIIVAEFYKDISGNRVRVMLRAIVLNATFNNISVISWRSVSLVGDTQRKPPTCCKSLTNFIT
jgi:hypothetical protein